jgi:hypothetical protein
VHDSDLRESLGIEDDQILSIVESILTKWSNSEDDAAERLELKKRVWERVNNPKKQLVFGVQDILLLALSKAREIHNESRIDGKWMPGKIAYLTMFDLLTLGFRVPDLSLFKQWRHGIYNPSIAQELTRLSEDQYIEVGDGPPAFYRLTTAGLDRVAGVIGPKFEEWEDFTDSLSRILKFWLVASYEEPALVKQYTKALPEVATGQVRIDKVPEEASAIRQQIDTRIQAKLRRIEEMELPPIEALDDNADSPSANLGEMISRYIEDKALSEKYYSPKARRFPIVQAIGDVFPDEDGHLTNYYIPDPQEESLPAIFAFVLGVCGKEDIRKVVMLPKEYGLLRRFDWQRKGIDVYVTTKQAIKSMGTSPKISIGDRVLVFAFRDSEGVNDAVYQLVNAGSVVYPTLYACRSWEKLDRWRSHSRIRCKAAPHSISLSLGKTIFSADSTVADLDTGIRPDRVRLAQQLASAIKHTEFGLIMAPNGSASGLFVQRKRLQTDMSGPYHALINLARTDIMGLRPDIVLAPQNVEFAGEISEFLSVPLARLILEDGAGQIELNDKFIDLHTLGDELRGKRVVYLCSSDNEIDVSTLDALTSICEGGAEVRTYVLFDTMMMSRKERSYFGISSAVGYAEFWKVPALTDLIEKELTYRREVFEFTIAEQTKHGQVPEVHEFF